VITSDITSQWNEEESQWKEMGRICYFFSETDVQTSDVPIKAELLWIYPNPAVDHLFIKLSDETFSDIQDREVTIYDLYGKVLLVKNLQDIDYIDISSLPQGTYIIRLLQKDRVLVGRFIKLPE